MRILFLVVLILSGCAIPINNSAYNDGLDGFRDGNYSVAFGHFKKCYADNRTPECAYYAGSCAMQLHNIEDAKRWMTTAARFGERSAIEELTKNGWAVPTADLADPKEQQRELDAISWDIQCRKLGFMDGTKEYNDCIVQVAMQMKAAERKQQQAAQPSFSQALGQGLQGAAAVLQSGGQARQTYQPPPQQQPVYQPSISYDANCLRACQGRGSDAGFCNSKCSY